MANPELPARRSVDRTWLEEAFPLYSLGNAAMVIFRQVLVPVDGSPWSEQAIAHAIAIAADHHADIHFVHVIARARTKQAYDEGEHAMHAAGEKLLDHALDRACEHDLLGTSAVLATDDKRRTVAQQILWAAGAGAADLIVCGSHGTG